MVVEGARLTLSLYRREATKDREPGTGRPGPKRPGK
jgi:hypothetical protein